MLLLSGIWQLLWPLLKEQQVGVKLRSRTMLACRNICPCCRPKSAPSSLLRCCRDQALDLSARIGSLRPCHAAVRAMATAATGRPSVGKLAPEETALLICDVQERFRPVISGFPAVVDTSRRMVSLSPRASCAEVAGLHAHAAHPAAGSIVLTCSWRSRDAPVCWSGSRSSKPLLCKWWLFWCTALWMSTELDSA